MDKINIINSEIAKAQEEFKKFRDETVREIGVNDLIRKFKIFS